MPHFVHWRFLFKKTNEDRGGVGHSQISIQRRALARVVRLGPHGLLILSTNWKKNAARLTKSSGSIEQL